MRSKTILITLFLLSVVALGAILWRNANVPTQTVTAAVKEPKVMILGSAQPLRTGTLLRAEDVKWVDWNDAIPAGSVVRPSQQERTARPDADVQALSTVFGAVLKQRVVDAGTPIVSSMIVKPGDRGFLAAVLAPGYRAVSIGVNPVSGASGLIFPGDHVDMILTQDFQKGDEPISRRSVSETIVTNVRVLAIDQRLQEATPDPKNQNPIPRTVTLEVLPKQAEMINVAVQLGTLSLTLRSVPLDAESVTADNPPVKEAIESTWADDVSPALKAPKQSTIIHQTIIMHGGKTENVAN